MRHLRNIFNLGIKELRSLLGDKAMLTLIVFSFTVSVYSSATVTPGSLNLAPIAIADMDQSQLSNRIVNSFYRPWFFRRFPGILLLLAGKVRLAKHFPWTPRAVRTSVGHTDCCAKFHKGLVKIPCTVRRNDRL